MNRQRERSLCNPKDNFTRIPNAVLDKEARTHFPGRSHQIYKVIQRKTLGFNKQWDKISYSQFKAATGIRRDGTISECTQNLKERNIIHLRKDSQRSSTTRSRRRTTISYCINPELDQWIESGLNLSNSSRKKLKLRQKILLELAGTKESSQKTSISRVAKREHLTEVDTTRHADDLKPKSREDELERLERISMVVEYLENSELSSPHNGQRLRKLIGLLDKIFRVAGEQLLPQDFLWIAQSRLKDVRTIDDLASKIVYIRSHPTVIRELASNSRKITDRLRSKHSMTDSKNGTCD